MAEIIGSALGLAIAVASARAIFWWMKDRDMELAELENAVAAERARAKMLDARAAELRSVLRVTGKI